MRIMPRKPSVPRTRQIHLLLSEDEDVMLTVGANRAGLTVSDYVRQLIRADARAFEKSPPVAAKR